MFTWIAKLIILKGAWFLVLAFFTCGPGGAFLLSYTCPNISFLGFFVRVFTANFHLGL
ncbi:hypothetical protein NSE_0207 [Neorickettsia sennetsu str. Miyayama]|uniref:Uncharacterized protein n=1 Tax=Ehrlichia sennetsu (strain ATCC VR-367 / Miyayama) TaxID=222891 RepID=Q2GEJ4_EHRS3|nr:hypothetical protein NSE_0207 [Neorickettsia sennetsu str. Miyayama]